jgi:hypothetical protein
MPVMIECCYFHLLVLSSHLYCLLILQVTTYRCLDNGSFAVQQAYVYNPTRKTMPDACGC